MRVLVCGGRTFGWPLGPDATEAEREAVHRQWETLNAVLDGYRSWLGDEVSIIEGEAKGADLLSSQWAQGYGITVHKFPADWDQYGRAAGPIRNKQMLEVGKPQLVIAFTNVPLAESRGTANMVMQSRAAGVPVVVVEVL